MLADGDETDITASGLANCSERSPTAGPSTAGHRGLNEGWQRLSRTESDPSSSALQQVSGLIKLSELECSGRIRTRAHDSGDPVRLRRSCSSEPVKRPVVPHRSTSNPQRVRLPLRGGTEMALGVCSPCAPGALLRTSCVQSTVSVDAARRSGATRGGAVPRGLSQFVGA